MTIQEYIDIVNKEGITEKDLPKDLQEFWWFAVEATQDHTSTEAYEEAKTVREAMDDYMLLFEKLREKEGKPESTTKKDEKKPKASKNKADEIVYVLFRNKAKGYSADKKFFTGENAYKRAEQWAKKEFEKFDPDIIHYSNKKEMTAFKKKEGSSTVKSKKSIKKENVPNPNAKKVEAFSIELKFIRRYVNMHGKDKTRNQIRLFINALQKAIRDKLIRKTSKYAKEILEIQENLITSHGQFENDSQILKGNIKESRRIHYQKILGKEIEYYSVKFIKSYINLQGKIVENKQAANLLTRINNAIKRQRLDKRDPYWAEVEDIIQNLNSFIKKNAKHGVLQIEERSLNGLQGIVDCGCQTSEVFDGVRIPEALDVEKLTEEYFLNKKQGDDRFLMNSKTYSDIEFQTLGFFGKWLQLFGDPEVGFSAVIKGSPKMGKSTLAIEFSGDMAKDFGEVLYIAREEGKSETFKRKLEEAAAMHDNLYVSNYIPVNVGDYRFVVVDSVTKMGLSSRNLEALSNSFNSTSFIGVHQVTKDGKARGTNEFIHDADVIIDVYAPGMASSRGRFNEGGELNFFNALAA